MSDEESTMAVSDPTTVGDWVRERVAYYLEADPATIDVDTPLAEYGLDSLYALTLCGDIEDHFELVLEPTLAWDHPTISAIARYLADLPAPEPDSRP
jgi:acyl carrier protein